MVNVNVFDVNDPRSAEMMHEAEKQGEAWEHLMGGRRAMMGNAWDPWNQMGISWSIYNDFKNKGYDDEKIAEIVKNSKQFPALEKMKKQIEDYKTRM